MKKFSKNRSAIQQVISSNKGFSLIEVIIAIGVLGIALVGQNYIQKDIAKTSLSLKSDLEAIELFNETYQFFRSRDNCVNYFSGKTIPDLEQESANEYERYDFTELESITDAAGKTIISKGQEADSFGVFSVDDVYVEVDKSFTYLAIEFSRGEKGSGLKEIKRKFILNLVKNASGIVTDCFDISENVKNSIKRRACLGYDGVEFNERTKECERRILPLSSACNANGDDSLSDGGFIHGVRIKNGSYVFDCRQKGVVTNQTCPDGSRATGFTSDGSLNCKKIHGTEIISFFDTSSSFDASGSCVAQAGFSFDGEKYSISGGAVAGVLDCTTQWNMNTQYVATIPIGSTSVFVPSGDGTHNRCICNGTSSKRCPVKYIAGISQSPNECGVKCDHPSISPQPGAVEFRTEGTLPVVGPRNCTVEEVLVSTSCGPCMPSMTQTCTYNYQDVVTVQQGECGACPPLASRSDSDVVSCTCGDTGQTCCSGSVCHKDTDFCNGSNVCELTPPPPPPDPCPSGSALIGEGCSATCPCSTGLCVTGMCQPCGTQGLACGGSCPCTDGTQCISGFCSTSGGCTPPRVLDPGSDTCVDCLGTAGSVCGGSCACGAGLDCLPDPNLPTRTICTPCGSDGQNCCASGTDCQAGLCCNDSGVCSSFGSEGNSCSTTCPCSGSDLLCSTISSLCESCGEKGQQCCTGDICNTGLACISGTCQECGDEGEVCCAGNTCNDSSLQCNASNICEKIPLKPQCDTCTNENECESNSCTSGICAPTNGDLCTCGTAYSAYDVQCVTCEWEAPSGSVDSVCATQAPGTSVTLTGQCLCNGVADDPSRCGGDAPILVVECPAAGCQKAQDGESCSQNSDCCNDSCVNNLCTSGPSCLASGESCGVGTLSCCPNLACFDDGSGNSICGAGDSCQMSGGACTSNQDCCNGLECNNNVCTGPITYEAEICCGYLDGSFDYDTPHECQVQGGMGAAESDCAGPTMITVTTTTLNCTCAWNDPGPSCSYSDIPNPGGSNSTGTSYQRVYECNDSKCPGHGNTETVSCTCHSDCRKVDTTDSCPTDQHNWYTCP